MFYRHTSWPLSLSFSGFLIFPQYCLPKTCCNLLFFQYVDASYAAAQAVGRGGKVAFYVASDDANAV